MGCGGVDRSELETLVIGEGPGSFTGIRVGTGVAQGLALGTGLPVLPVSSLAALAQGLGADRVLAAFDADELDAIQWDSLEEEMANSVDYDINPDYAEMYEIYSAAKREREG